MIELTASVEIDATAEEIWVVLADYALDPTWRTGVLSMIPSAPGLAEAGTTTREELRLAGRTWINLGIITEVEPARRLAWRTTDGADASGERRIQPLDEGRCRVTLDLRVHPHGAERLVAPMLARLLARNLRRDLDRLHHVVVRQASSTA